MSDDKNDKKETVTNDLLYEVLKSLQKGQTEIQQEIGDLKFRIGSVERGLASMHESFVHQTTRLDRIDTRLKTIEKRLDLVDA